jgi:putative ABC transport system permease protein
MNRFALLSLYRSLTRHKLYAALNIGGLAIGIAVFIVLGLYVRFETSYEQWLPHHEEIYAIQSEWKDQSTPFPGRYVETMGGLLDQLREDFPDLVGTRIMGGEGGGIVQRGTPPSPKMWPWSTRPSSRCSTCRWSRSARSALWPSRTQC